jgi:hypothetical protein
MLITLCSGAAHADVLIDEFTHVDDYWGNPWPLVLTEPEIVDAYELVTDGVIEGEYGRVRETSIHISNFDTPGEDSIRLSVETATGTFDYDATSGVYGEVRFSYGYQIDNDLNADFSAEHGLRIDFAELQLEPGPCEFLRFKARIVDSNYVLSESDYLYVYESGPQSVLLPFATYDAAAAVDLTDIGALKIYLYATRGTSYSIERLVAGRTDPGDANADGIVDALDLLALFAQWGECPNCLADFNDDAVVDVPDFLILLAHWVDAS